MEEKNTRELTAEELEKVAGGGIEIVDGRFCYECNGPMIRTENPKEIECLVCGLRRSC